MDCIQRHISSPLKSLCNIPSKMNSPTSCSLSPELPGQSVSSRSIVWLSISSQESIVDKSIPSAVSSSANCKIDGAVIQCTTIPSSSVLSSCKIFKSSFIVLRLAISSTFPPSSLVTCTNIGLVSLPKCSLILSCASLDSESGAKSAKSVWKDGVFITVKSATKPMVSKDESIKIGHADFLKIGAYERIFDSRSSLDTVSRPSISS
ncbi:MAG: Uncharacterised protein [Methanobacteriota archaeon]|nr:MAG: Uncharacterised protein [Euryarchaeota archaeon]